MEKYIAAAVDNHSFFSQIVTSKNASGNHQVVTLPHSVPEIPVGTKFKVYETADKEPFPLAIAYSYRIGSKRFVNIPRQPITMPDVARFWDKLGFWDSVCLQNDIRQALRRKKITPALNRNTNLLLLLGRAVIR